MPGVGLECVLLPFFVFPITHSVSLLKDAFWGTCGVKWQSLTAVREAVWQSAQEAEKDKCQPCSVHVFSFQVGPPLLFISEIGSTMHRLPPGSFYFASHSTIFYLLYILWN